MYTSTDRGTETPIAAAIHCSLQHILHPDEDPSSFHKFVCSKHNQKVECLWSQILKRKGRNIMDIFARSLEDGIWDMNNPLQQ